MPPLPYKINFPPKHFHHVLTSHLQNHSSTICLALALSVVDHEPMKNHHFFFSFSKNDILLQHTNTQKDFIFFHSLLIVILLLCRDDVKQTNKFPLKIISLFSNIASPYYILTSLLLSFILSNPSHFKIVIFYTEILTGKVVLWCFFLE